GGAGRGPRPWGRRRGPLASRPSSPRKVVIPPRLEHHQGPEPLPVVASTGQVLGHETADSARLEQALTRRAIGREPLFHARPERAPEPSIERHAEALLPPGQHFAR